MWAVLDSHHFLLSSVITHTSSMLLTWHSKCSSKHKCLFIQNSVRVPTGILHVSLSVQINLKGDLRNSGKSSRMFMSVPLRNPCRLVSVLQYSTVAASHDWKASRPWLISINDSVTRDLPYAGFLLCVSLQRFLVRFFNTSPIFLKRLNLLHSSGCILDIYG